MLYSDELAFKCGNKSVTFLEFNKRVNRLICALQGLGVPKGAVLSILSWNCLEYTEIYGAAMKGGFIASPFNARLQEDELEYLINYSETHTLFIGAEFVEMISDSGGKIYACKASVDMFHLDMDDFCPQVDKIITVGDFYEIAAGGNIIFT